MNTLYSNRRSLGQRIKDAAVLAAAVPAAFAAVLAYRRELSRRPMEPYGSDMTLVGRVLSWVAVVRYAPMTWWMDRQDRKVSCR